MSELDLLYTDVEDALRASVRDLLARRCPPARVTALYDGDRSLVAELWPAVAGELGLAGLLVAEELGGAGAGPREAAVVLEELGRAVAPVPFLTSSVIAATVLAGSAPAAEHLRALADARTTFALAVPLPASAAGPATLRAELSGRVTSVAGALEADVLLVPVGAGGDVEIHAVQAGDVAIEPVTSLDMSRQLADVVLDAPPSTVVVPADAGAAALGRALHLGAAMLAAEQVGVAQWCLDTTVAYLKDRRQFGRPVGGFQALKHRLADVWAEVESARAAARYAAATAAVGDPDAELAATLAQAYCSPMAVHAAEECVQLHGGLGMTWEYPAHLYLKRAKADEIALGTPESHRARLAELVHLPAAG